MIEKELRTELFKLSDEEFIETMENLKKGIPVTIGKKQYNNHSSKAFLHQQ